MNAQDTRLESQRARIIARLKEHPATTIDMMKELNVMRPAARIRQLRDRGHDIRTHLMAVDDEWGRTHTQVALYYLPTQDCVTQGRGNQ